MIRRHILNFEQFWMHNIMRYLKLAEINVVLAINTAAEDAWEIAMSDTVPASERHRIAYRLSRQVNTRKKCGKETKTIASCETCDASD